ncbi:Vesicle-associated protein 4-1 [Orobanche minor]
MAIADSSHHHHKWGLCPFWQSATQSCSSSSSTQNLYNQSQNHGQQNVGVASSTRSSAVSSVVRSILPARRRLRLDPSNNLYFPYEPGKQARSAVRINNSSKSLVAFKFQTTAPKSCYMRPPGGILAPGEGLIATVFKFVEHPENSEKAINQSKVKFKIMSLKVKEGIDYVPELFDEHRDQVTVERILRVVFLDPERANPALDKLKRQLAEADAALEARKKPPPADTGPRVVGEGLVIDEWKERREKYLARQQVKAVNSG